MIRCQDLSFVVKTPQGERRILGNVSFEAASGSVTWLRGPSGAGKSTLLSILAAIRRPTSGQVLVDERPVSRYTAAHRDLFRQRIGMVHQQMYLLEELTALENVLLPLAPRRSVPVDMPSRAAQLLAAVDIDPASTQQVRTLSGGERQRVAFARALLPDPEILLLDEPTAHQDDTRASVMLSLALQKATAGSCVVVASHDSRVKDGLQPSLTITLLPCNATPRE